MNEADAIYVLDTGSTDNTVKLLSELGVKVTIQEMINDNGPFYVTDDPNYTKHPKCWYFNSYGRGHGRLNVVGAIMKSCNYYFYDLGYRLSSRAGGYNEDAGLIKAVICRIKTPLLQNINRVIICRN